VGPITDRPRQQTCLCSRLSLEDEQIWKQSYGRQESTCWAACREGGTHFCHFYETEQALLDIRLNPPIGFVRKYIIPLSVTVFDRSTSAPSTVSCSSRITLKALANSSPGLALWQPWDKTAHLFVRNPERVASKGLRNSFRVATNLLQRSKPRVSKQTLGSHSRTLSALSFHDNRALKVLH
jgi:hypothetical protein